MHKGCNFYAPVFSQMGGNILCPPPLEPGDELRKVNISKLFRLELRGVITPTVVVIPPPPSVVIVSRNSYACGR